MKLSEANEYIHTPQMLTTKDEIEAWLSDYGVMRYTINDDLTVDVQKNVDLTGRHLNHLLKLIFLIMICVHLKECQTKYWAHAILEEIVDFLPGNLLLEL